MAWTGPCRSGSSEVKKRKNNGGHKKKSNKEDLKRVGTKKVGVKIIYMSVKKVG